MTLHATVANDLVNYLCRGTAPTSLTTAMKISLHTGDPGATGANEATGGSYARQTAGYNTASGGSCVLAATLDFTALAAATYTHMGIWDNTGTPKFILGSAFAASKTLSGGDTLSLTSATTSISGS